MQNTPIKEEPRVINRMSPPTKWDQLPKDTIVDVISTKESFIQRNSDSKFPIWEKI